MIRNNNKLTSTLKVDKRTREIIKKILKQLELTENPSSNSKCYYINNTQSKYLN